MKIILLPIAVLILLVLIFSNNSTPNWGDGTDAFYREVLNSDGNFVENTEDAVFDNQPVSSISKIETENLLAQDLGDKKTQVLGLHTASDGAEKWIEIDLSDLKLYGWQGNQKFYEFSISTGRPGYETPPGEYRVWRKVRSQRYKGGTPGTSGYYNLPNVPYSLFFGGNGLDNWKGYAIHGAYWHNDFGIKNRSSGCINLEPVDAGKLYLWAGPLMSEDVGAINTTDDNPGVRVVIHE